MSPRNLADLIDLAALPSNYAANELDGVEGGWEGHANGNQLHLSHAFQNQKFKRTRRGDNSGGGADSFSPGEQYVTSCHCKAR